MPIQPLILTRIHQLERLNANRTDGPRTRLDAELAGHGRQQLELPGHPPIREGMAVSAWLETADDWASLAGWRDWTHDTVILPSLSHSLAWAAGAGLAGLIYAVQALRSLQSARPDFFAMLLAAGAGVVSVLAVLKYRRLQRIRTALQQAQPPGLGPQNTA